MVTEVEENKPAYGLYPDLGVIGRGLLWLQSTKDIVLPPTVKQSAPLTNPTHFSKDEFYERDVHIFGDSFAQGFKDEITFANGKVVQPPHYPTAAFIKHRLRVRQGVNWRLHNHADGGSTINMARGQVREFHQSGETDQTRPDVHSQVGGIDFVALLNDPRTNQHVVTLSRLFEEDAKVLELLKDRQFRKGLRDALHDIPLIVHEKREPFKEDLRKYTNELILGGSMPPKRTFMYGQPDGGIIDLVQAQLLAINESYRGNVKNVGGHTGTDIVSALASGISQIIETDSSEVFSEFVDDNKKLLKEADSEVLFIRYRNRLQRRHIQTEHPSVQGQIVIARAVMEKCFYNGQSFTSLAA